MHLSHNLEAMKNTKANPERKILIAKVILSFRLPNDIDEVYCSGIENDTPEWTESIEKAKGFSNLEAAIKSARKYDGYVILF